MLYIRMCTILKVMFETTFSLFWFDCRVDFSIGVNHRVTLSVVPVLQRVHHLLGFWGFYTGKWQAALWSALSTVTCTVDTWKKTLWGRRLKNIKRKERKWKQNFVFYLTFVWLTFCAETFGQFKSKTLSVTRGAHLGEGGSCPHQKWKDTHRWAT